jgi:hypothetical protein
MLFQEQFDQKVKDLWASQLARVRVKKFKSGKRAGMVRVPAQPLPFTITELWQMLDSFCGRHAVPCPYCNVPIDILSLTIDHRIPRALGGGYGLDNLQPCCKRCNQLKEKLMPDDFKELLRWLGTVPTYMRSNIESRLLGSLRKLDFSKKAKGPSWVPPPKEQQMALEDDDF